MQGEDASDARLEISQMEHPPLDRRTLKELILELIAEERSPRGAFTREEAAHYLNISERQLARLTAEKKIPVLRYPGRLVRYRKEDLDKFMEKYRVR